MNIKGMINSNPISGLKTKNGEITIITTPIQNSILPSSEGLAALGFVLTLSLSPIWLFFFLISTHH
jgi:hypothetical protein